MLSNNSKIGLLKDKFQQSIVTGIPMWQKLFLFLVVLVLTIILGVIAILMITGTFTAGLSESENIVNNELLHASERISQEYGLFSRQAIELSRNLSKSIEKKTDALGISISDLHNHPEMLEEIISNEYERTLFSLQISKSSGVFFILNSTVNPELDDANISKAGLYIKNMEPNIINSSTPTIIVLRGFPSISRSNSIPLHAQWKMEFDISNAPYYHRPIVEANANNNLPLSRLYYWSTTLTFPGTSEEVMLCSVPLIDSNGNVFGVCGVEVSSMLFKLSHMPSSNIYNRLFCVLSPTKGDTINLDQSMLAGSFSARVISRNNDALKISKNRDSFFYYKQNEDSSFWGTHTPIDLYPEDSVFSDDHWVVAIMIPDKDVVTSVAKLNLLLFSLLILLVVLGIITSFFLSKRFIKPISKGFDIIKSTDLSEAPKTKIPEIDDLIEFLNVHNEKLYEQAKSEDFSLSILDEFLENTKKLSPAERSVFNLYVKGYTAREIAEILYLSINTIKTHNKRIYMKLNVASRDELLVYINMLKEVGKEIDL